MPISSLEGLTDGQKEELVASLACLIIGDDVDAEKISAVATASGNNISDAMAGIFATVVSKSPKGIEAFSPAPGGGGGWVTVVRWWSGGLLGNIMTLVVEQFQNTHCFVRLCYYDDMDHLHQRVKLCIDEI